MKVTSSTENQYFYEYLNFLNDRQKEMELVKKVIDVTNSKDSIEQLNKKTLAIDNSVKITNVNITKQNIQLPSWLK